MEVKLSILIPYTQSRLKELASLLKSLNRQNSPNIEIVLDDHETNSIGKKRNELLLRSKGEYIVFIDSDDHISKDYVGKILNAIETKPDCIGLSGIMTTNGIKKRQWHISKDFKTWHKKNNIYYRTPNHISPVKREIALQAMFPETSFGEDAEYSKRILPLLKTETIIKGNIYHYDYRKK